LGIFLAMMFRRGIPAPAGLPAGGRYLSALFTLFGVFGLAGRAAGRPRAQGPVSRVICSG